MNRAIIGVIFAFAGAFIVYKKENIRIQKLEDENIRLVSLVERLKYKNDKQDKLLKQNFLKESFDILKNNMCIKKPKTKEDEILINSDSSDSFEELNQKTEIVDSESLNSEDDSSKSKMDLSSSNLV